MDGLEPLPEAEAVALVRKFAETAQVPPLARPDRQAALQLWLALLQEHGVAAAIAGVDIADATLTAIDEEKDPRCLLLSFQIVQATARVYHTAGVDASVFDGHAEELVSTLACYFPVRFKPPTSDPAGITRAQLSTALEGALSCSPFLARWVLPLVLDKLSSTYRPAKEDSMSVLAKCCASYGREAMGPHLLQVWAGLCAEAVAPAEPGPLDADEAASRRQLAAAACASLRACVAALGPGSLDALVLADERVVGELRRALATTGVPISAGARTLGGGAMSGKEMSAADRAVWCAANVLASVAGALPACCDAVCDLALPWVTGALSPPPEQPLGDAQLYGLFMLHTLLVAVGGEAAREGNGGSIAAGDGSGAAGVCALAARGGVLGGALLALTARVTALGQQQEQQGQQQGQQQQGHELHGGGAGEAGKGGEDGGEPHVHGDGCCGGSHDHDDGHGGSSGNNAGPSSPPTSPEQLQLQAALTWAALGALLSRAARALATPPPQPRAPAPSPPPEEAAWAAGAAEQLARWALAPPPAGGDWAEPAADARGAAAAPGAPGLAGPAVRSARVARRMAWGAPEPLQRRCADGALALLALGARGGGSGGEGAEAAVLACVMGAVDGGAGDADPGDEAREGREQALALATAVCARGPASFGRALLGEWGPLVVAALEGTATPEAQATASALLSALASGVLPSWLPRCASGQLPGESSKETTAELALLAQQILGALEARAAAAAAAAAFARPSSSSAGGTDDDSGMQPGGVLPLPAAMAWAAAAVVGQLVPALPDAGAAALGAVCAAMLARAGVALELAAEQQQGQQQEQQQGQGQQQQQWGTDAHAADPLPGAASALPAACAAVAGCSAHAPDAYLSLPPALLQLACARASPRLLELPAAAALASLLATAPRGDAADVVAAAALDGDGGLLARARGCARAMRALALCAHALTRRAHARAGEASAAALAVLTQPGPDPMQQEQGQEEQQQREREELVDAAAQLFACVVCGSPPVARRGGACGGHGARLPGLGCLSPGALSRPLWQQKAFNAALAALSGALAPGGAEAGSSTGTGVQHPEQGPPRGALLALCHLLASAPAALVRGEGARAVPALVQALAVLPLGRGEPGRATQDGQAQKQQTRGGGGVGVGEGEAAALSGALRVLRVFLSDQEAKASEAQGAAVPPVPAHLSDEAQRMTSALCGLVTLPGSACVREAALGCLEGAMATLPYHMLHPVRRQVLATCGGAVDDNKRSVRAAAIRCRKAWSSV
ncbi:hypothetical protein FOA52_008535 [Chlamydomonas sp. UWO 241]|nr:hypothetical protein FOA52_008535 [Chlamydomonas sp. UWO 241]